MPDCAGTLAGVLPAAFFASFGSGFFLATGFAARLDGECFGERVDLATGFFFAGFFGADFAFDGLAERFGVRDFGAGRFAAAASRAASPSPWIWGWISSRAWMLFWP